MRIAIFGSCVSRDTAEVIPNAEVITYVARHSVTSLETPHGTTGVDLQDLSSAFQRRMVVGDLNGNGLSRILEHSGKIDLILLDLVDERRGYWKYVDGTTMTNSIEIESSGVAQEARRKGARLVDFGTEEHFRCWKSGYAKLIDGLKDAGLWNRTILLDIEWASAVDGATHAQSDTLAKLGRNWRRLQRGAREAGRSLSRGQGVSRALTKLLYVSPTEAEGYADRATAANADYVRYRTVATSLVASTISRSSNQVRIGKDHKWGPQPFHYRKDDYLSIQQEILSVYNAWVATEESKNDDN